VDRIIFLLKACFNCSTGVKLTLANIPEVQAAVKILSGVQGGERTGRGKWKEDDYEA